MHGENIVRITHVVPGIGPVEFRLYPPADELYEQLSCCGEIDRLRRLKHAGAMEQVLPGLSHSRWDYVASMLFLSDRLKLPRTNSNCSFGSLKFSSVISAIQCAALLTNIGHLPGTFAVEKGVVQWLQKRSPESPSHWLPWCEETSQELLEDADRYLLTADYGGFNRVLSVVKLGDFCVKLNDKNLVDIAAEFYTPFIFVNRRKPRQAIRWRNLDQHYQTVRHIAYLNLDAAFADVPVQVNVSGMLTLMKENHHEFDTLLEQAQEILGAYEHSVYEKLYHRDECRKQTALVAHTIREQLSESKDPTKELQEWLYSADIGDVFDTDQVQQKSREVSKLASVSVRTHWVGLPQPTAKQELELEAHMGSPNSKVASIFVYVPWERYHHIEPPHTYLDFWTSDTPSVDDVGRTVLWIANNLDSSEMGSLHEVNFISLLQKQDTGKIYESLISDAINIAWGNLTLQLEPWPLAQLSSVYPPGIQPVGAWSANWKLDDPHIKSLLRRNKRTVPDEVKSQHAELMGLSNLRSQLRNEYMSNSKQKTKRLRQRHLVVTSSIRILQDDNRVAEFDGGIIKIASRSGRVTFYGLETKSGDPPQKALKALNTKLHKLQLSEVESRKLGGHSAYCKIPLI